MSLHRILSEYWFGLQAHLFPGVRPHFVDGQETSQPVT